MSVYKREHPLFLRQSLDTLFSQTVQPSEVVLVKDGPLTAESEEVLEEYMSLHKELKVVALAQNQGLGKALNEGLKHCSYELIARMDTDDICKPFRFEKQLRAFEEHPEIDVCSSWIDEFEVNKEHITSNRIIPENHSAIATYAKTRCPVNHVAVMYKKNAVLSGGYKGFPEDYYLWVKMIMNDMKFYNIQESLVWVRFSRDVLKRRGVFIRSVFFLFLS